MTTELSEATVSDLLLPGYRIHPATGAWCSLPWPTDDEAKSKIIRSSLGPSLIAWAEGRSGEPGLTDYLTGRPLELTDGQKRFYILWYHVGRDGRFTYRSGVKRGAKGTGKDPMGAMFCDMELCGPVELYDWDDKTGTPIGRRRMLPLVQIMSNSEAQSKDVLRIANAMWNQEARDWYSLDCGETRTIVKTGGRLEVPTSSEASAEGDPATAIFLNETHHMTAGSGGHRIAQVARRNVGKSPRSIQARVLEATNAHQQGMDSAAERSFQAWQHQLSRNYSGRRDILYDSIEAPPNTDIMTEHGRMRGLRAAYMDAEWADLERISQEMVDQRTSVADMIRYYLNGLATEEDAWVAPPAWDALSAPGTVVADGDRIAMFLDCSKSTDATGLVACRLDDMFVFQLGIWQRPRGERGHGWLAPREEVDAEVRAAMARYDVVWLGVDPSPAKDDSDEALYWMQAIDRWHRDFKDQLPLWATPGAVIGNSVLFDMRMSQQGGLKRNAAFTMAAEMVAKWIDEEGLDGPLRHDGSAELRTHVHNARRRPNQWGVTLGKVTRDSNKLVDLAVCMVGAVMGAREALNSGKLRPKRGPTRVIVLS
jgi:hypothetical protein